MVLWVGLSYVIVAFGHTHLLLDASVAIKLLVHFAPSKYAYFIFQINMTSDITGLVVILQ